MRAIQGLNRGAESLVENRTNVCKGGSQKVISQQALAYPEDDGTGPAVPAERSLYYFEGWRPKR
jgi:hypothetical protein